MVIFSPGESTRDRALEPAGTKEDYVACSRGLEVAEPRSDGGRLGLFNGSDSPGFVDGAIVIVVVVVVVVARMILF